jgi:cell cycle arrest protein BUB3
MATQFEISDPPADGISNVAFAPSYAGPDSSGLLLASSWDGTVRLYDTQENVQLLSLPLGAPVTNVAWGADGVRQCFTVGIDKTVRMVDMNAQTDQIMGTHDAGLRSCVYSEGDGNSTHVKVYVLKLASC